MRHLSDERLVKQIARGSELAFEEFYRRYSAKAYNLAMRITRDFGLAEDAVSASFATLWRKAKSFRGDSTARAWFYRVVFNQTLMILRVKKRHFRECPLGKALTTGKSAWEEQGLENDLSEPEDPAKGPFERTADSELREAIELAIGELDPAYGTVFCLRDIDGLANHEVAEILDISIPAVKSRLHRARLTLRRKLVCRKIAEDHKEIVGL